jgi:hypothetical protein
MDQAESVVWAWACNARGFRRAREDRSLFRNAESPRHSVHISLALYLSVLDRRLLMVL